MDWKELRDGSLRIEQHLITHKQSQRKILVGKKGSKIGYNALTSWFLVLNSRGLRADFCFDHANCTLAREYSNSGTTYAGSYAEQ